MTGMPSGQMYQKVTLPGGLRVIVDEVPHVRSVSLAYAGPLKCVTERTTSAAASFLSGFILPSVSDCFAGIPVRWDAGFVVSLEADVAAFTTVAALGAAIAAAAFAAMEPPGPPPTTTRSHFMP